MNADEYEVDGSLRIPRVLCDENAFFRYRPHLSTREQLCWALRTETILRLAKIKGRLGVLSEKSSEDEEEDYIYSRVLKSKYLLDLYPEENNEKQPKSDTSARGHDEYDFSCKAHSQLSFVDVGIDDNFDGLTRIQIEKKKKAGKKRPYYSYNAGEEEELACGSDSDDNEGNENDKKAANRKKQTDMKRIIPPTLLHFRIVLEAYTGYNLGTRSTSASCYNSPDTSIPRSAIMGGAVVAALTSFQDEVVVQAFASCGIFTERGELIDGDIYSEKKQALIKKLHTHFLYLSQQHRSVYSKGDTDIFLQASPLTQALMNIFEGHGISDDQINLIGSYIGNSGRNSICAGDFERYAEIVMGKNGKIKAPDETLFAFAASKHASSFILGTDGEDDAWNQTNFDEVTWPRTSQFIQLDIKADLLGELFDFDQSIAACAFDGVSVRVAPRAALSLMTNANFVTPFCLEEHRNKQRVVKYSQRGFKPFLVDPYDGRQTQNVACDAVIARKPFLPRGNCRYQSGRQQTWSGEDWDEVLGTQERKMNEGEERMLCCHRLNGDRDLRGRRTKYLGDTRSLYEPGDLDQDAGGATYMHTMKLFERSPGDAIDFFSRRFRWSAEDMILVKEVDPYLRMACQKCKQDYNLIRVVMAKYPDLLKEYDLNDDILHGQFAYSSSNCSSFEPSFYSGGVFNSTHVRNRARRALKIYAMLQSQSVFELSAYVTKHGSAEGYKKRFVFHCGDYAESDLISTLRKAQRTVLQEPARPPIGLNPERFVEKCGQCQSWLVGNIYGSKDCKSCNDLPKS
mmetsp:Transcript_25249/g.38769  ORF Transcript_25249/g.38769 Transcript_25249/m.38769 type:complete len:796 (-) Transcript_25249:78-2465(-)